MHLNEAVCRLRARVRAVLRALERDTRGAATAEYVVLVGTVGLVAAGALVAFGPIYVRHFEAVRNLILTPGP